MSLHRKRVLVTGGSSGIGQAAALRLASDGARTAILDVTEGPSPTTFQQIESNGGQARFWRADVSREDEVAAAVDGAAQWLGGIDALVHCAGVLRGYFVDLQDVDLDTWNGVLAVNLTGTFFVARNVARHMTAAGGGVMVLVSSVGGVTRGSASYPYGASKGGMHGLALTLDKHLAPRGIRVHEVIPDSIDTPLYRRSVTDGLAMGFDDRPNDADLGTPAELAELMALLVTEDSGYLPLSIAAQPRIPRVGQGGAKVEPGPRR